jgi:protoheme IX farnesyltransferase
MLNRQAGHAALRESAVQVLAPEAGAAPRSSAADPRPPAAARMRQYWALTKPGVTRLAVFCAVIGMFLATDGLPGWDALVWGTVGIWLLAGAAGAWVLYTQVNPLTMWLTLATFVGYAVAYTVFLKPHTSQNIVIGGLSGAMPPALG